MATNRVLRADSIEGIVYDKNLFKNGFAHRGTEFWNRFLDSGTRPVDGTGGSPTANITWTRSTSTPLSDSASFLYSKINTINCQGEGVSTDITIDEKDKAKVLECRFDYEIVSGTYGPGSSSADSDLIVYFYRTTATGRLIEPSIFKLDGAVAGVKYTFRTEFQTDSDATGYRFIIYNATTTTNNFVVKFDNFYLGRSRNVAGAIVTSWTAIPNGILTSDLTTNVTVSGFRRRVGDTEDYQITFVFTGNNTQAVGGDLSISDRTFDTAKMADASTANFHLGIATLVDAASQSYFGRVRYINTNTVRIIATNASGTYTTPTGINPSTNVPFSFTSGDELNLNFSVPIVGWGASGTLGQDADTRVVGFSAIKAAGTFTHTSTGNNQDLPSGFWSSVTDSHGAFSPTTSGGTYTVPVAGNYDISAQVAFLGNVTGYRNVLILVNGVAVAYSTDFLGDSASIAPAPMARAYRTLRAGDTIRVQAYQNSGGNLNYLGTPLQYSQFIIRRDSGPAQVAAPEIVVAKASGDPASASSGNPIIFPTTVYDTHSRYNTSTGRFTCPSAGIYKIYGAVNSANTGVTLTIYKNASIDTVAGYTDSNGECSFIGAVSCVSGDVIDLRPNNTLDAGSGSVIHFERIGGIG